MWSLKLSAWKVGDRGFEPHSGLQVSKKKQNVSSPLTRNDSILWGTQEVLLTQYSPHVHKGGLKLHSFYFLLQRRLSCHYTDIFNVYL